MYGKLYVLRINFLFFLSSVWDVAYLFLDFLEDFRLLLLTRLAYKK